MLYSVILCYIIVIGINYPCLWLSPLLMAKSTIKTIDICSMTMDQYLLIPFLVG